MARLALRRLGARRRTLRWLPLLVLFGVGGLPCHWSARPAPALAQATPVREVRVRLAEWTLTTMPLRVVAGESVRFVASNAGALPHSLAVEGPDMYVESESIGSNQIKRLDVTFGAPGLYDLYCPIGAGQHRALGQEASVVVLAAGDTSETSAATTEPEEPPDTASAPSAVASIDSSGEPDHVEQ